MRRWPSKVLAFLAVASVGLLAAPSRAHPEGASSINRTLDFEYTGDAHFRVAYLIDFAEGPAYAEVDALDADHDGSVTPGEQRRYLDARLPVLMSVWVVDIDGQRVQPTIVACHLETSPGEGGLETLRIACELGASGPAPASGEDVTLHVKDESFAAEPGWREIRARDGSMPDAGLALSGSARPTEGGPSGRAPRVSEARFMFQSRPMLTVRWNLRRILVTASVVGLAVFAFYAAGRRWR